MIVLVSELEAENSEYKEALVTSLETIESLRENGGEILYFVG